MSRDGAFARTRIKVLLLSIISSFSKEDANLTVACSFCSPRTLRWLSAALLPQTPDVGRVGCFILTGRRGQSLHQSAIKPYWGQPAGGSAFEVDLNFRVADPLKVFEGRTPVRVLRYPCMKLWTSAPWVWAAKWRVPGRFAQIFFRLTQQGGWDKPALYNLRIENRIDWQRRHRKSPSSRVDGGSRCAFFLDGLNQPLWQCVCFA